MHDYSPHTIAEKMSNEPPLKKARIDLNQSIPDEPLPPMNFIFDHQCSANNTPHDSSAAFSNLTDKTIIDQTDETDQTDQNNQTDKTDE